MIKPEQEYKEFELTDEYALWYEYMYASEDIVISGETFKFDNVHVYQDWNKIISQTDDRDYFTYTGGIISGAVMEA